MDELDAIRLRYARREKFLFDRYSMQNVDAFLALEQRDHLIHRIFLECGVDFTAARVLEVGCGSGINLVRLITWGFKPEHLTGVELLPDRCDEARHRLPQAAMIVQGNAATVDFPQPFDIVLQSTTFSSILDRNLRRELADNMWRHTKPGGLVLSYDIDFNNPSNRDVSKVRLKELRQLFPNAGIQWSSRVTLAPPIGRRVSKSRAAYRLLASLPFLRSHRLIALKKPAEDGLGR